MVERFKNRTLSDEKRRKIDSLVRLRSGRILDRDL
jgi:hypothetical protein